MISPDYLPGFRQISLRNFEPYAWCMERPNIFHGIQFFMSTFFKLNPAVCDPLVMKSSATDADSESASFAPIYVVDGSSPEKRAQKCAGDFSVPYIAIFAALFLDHAHCI